MQKHVLLLHLRHRGNDNDVLAFDFITCKFASKYHTIFIFTSLNRKKMCFEMKFV